MAGLDRGVRPIGDWSILMILSIWSRPVIRRCAPGAAWRGAGDCHRLVQHLVDERGLAGAGHAGNAQNTPSGNFTSTSCRLCWTRPRSRDSRPAAAACRGTAISRLPDEEVAGERSWAAITSAGVPSRDEVAAVLARAGPEVDQVVRRAHGALVVLDDDHRVARGRAAARACRSAARCRAGEGRSRARRGCRGRRPGSTRSGWPAGSAAPRRPIASRPPARARDSRRPTLSRKLSRSSISRRIRRAIWRSVSVSSSDPNHSIARSRGHPRELVDSESADLDRQGLRPQPGAVALGARPHRHVLLDLLSRPLRVGLAIAALQVVHDPLEAGHVRPLRP